MDINVHHYTECGLDNIYVQGITFEDDAGQKFINIPALGELHCLISKALLEEKRPLTGGEFYFLRAEIGMNIQEISNKLNINPSYFKTWEKSHEVNNEVDFTFRDFFKKAYQEQLDQDISCWQQDIKIPDTYTEDTTNTQIRIEYGDDKHYHRLEVAA